MFNLCFVYSFFFSLISFSSVFFFLYAMPLSVCVHEPYRSVYVMYSVWYYHLVLRLQSPPASAKVPKSVSDRKRFFENAMEDHNKPAPKSGKNFEFSFNAVN